MTSHEWGRVADDGTVFVRTGDGEREVGQYPEGTAEEAMHFYVERYAALETEVSLLEQRVRAGRLSPEDATTRIKSVRSTVVEANAVGDLASLAGRLDSLGPVIAGQRQARRAERAKAVEASRAEKEKLVVEAEKLAGSRDWRNGVNRMRELLDSWKALPRLDKAADDELWKRFSGARTTYTKARKAHFSEQQGKRDEARVVKEKLATQAEALASSVEWGPTSGAYRDLMREWKAAGPAPRQVDDELWQRFRGAQDTFFGARDAANAALDTEFAANAEAKLAILEKAEALLPIKDVEAAKRSFRDLADQWDAAGKVPRDQIKDLEARIHKVETAIRGIEDDRWKRSDPEKSARADDMVGKLEAAIDGIRADLDAARAAGNDKQVKSMEENLASRQAFLDMAKRASSEFSG